MRKKIIAAVKRVVIKIGTSTVIDSNGHINKIFLKNFALSIQKLKKKNIEVCIVSSGAIGAGMEVLDLKKKPNKIPYVQALASIGQIEVISGFRDIFAEFDLSIGQILITHEVLNDRTRYLNTRNTINALFELNCIPVINENDTVSIEELTFGDNDKLASLVTNLIEADLLILLSDIDGLMTADPKIDPNAVLIKEVTETTPEILNLAGPSKSETGKGGLATKLVAANIVNSCGEAMIIANSKIENVIDKIMNGEELGTFFHPNSKNLQSRKRWLAFNLSERGSIEIDDGAVKALEKNGKSLLPAGILNVKGDFEINDLVLIIDEEGKVIGKGLSNYSFEDVNKIKGLQTKEIESVLGRHIYDSVIHRDHMVLIKEGPN